MVWLTTVEPVASGGQGRKSLPDRVLPGRYVELDAPEELAGEGGGQSRASGDVSCAVLHELGHGLGDDHETVTERISRQRCYESLVQLVPFADHVAEA